MTSDSLLRTATSGKEQSLLKFGPPGWRVPLQLARVTLGQNSSLRKEMFQYDSMLKSKCPYPHQNFSLRKPAQLWTRLPFIHLFSVYARVMKHCKTSRTVLFHSLLMKHELGGQCCSRFLSRLGRSAKALNRYHTGSLFPATME